MATAVGGDSLQPGVAGSSSGLRRISVFLPILAGFGAFAAVVGVDLLRPGNIAWLAKGDSPAFYLGWKFFKETPWSWPPGANPRNGLELSSSVFYSDSIPLVALLVKPLAPWLPGDFQYFGMWIALCFVLQACLGWALAGLVTRRVVGRLAVAVLFAFAPPFVLRLSGHYALMAQWAMLSALYLNLAPTVRLRPVLWPALVLATAMIHSYLLAMVLALFLADLARRWRPGHRPSLMAEAAATLGAMVLALYLVGFFTIRPNSGNFFAYGHLYRFNLLSFLDPGVGEPLGLRFSYVLPDLPGTAEDWEGFSYLGLGGLLLVAAALPYGLSAIRAAWRDRERRPLIVVLIGMALFALSHRVAIGPFELPFRPHRIAERISQLGNILRGSGRMAWPLHYALMLGAIAVVARSYRPGTATALLLAAALFQAVDTRAGWGPIGRGIAQEGGATWPSSRTSPFWQEAAARYRKVRIVPVIDHPIQWPEYADIAYFAASNGLGTDAAYLARYDRAAWERHTRDDVTEGATPEPDSLYILRDRARFEAASARLAPGDMLAEIDGYFVLAPGWNRRRDDSDAGPGRPQGLVVPAPVR